MTYTNLHLAIGMKLGWGAMPASVAIPAIDKIVENYVNVCVEIHGVSKENLLCDYVNTIKKDIMDLDPDYLFGYLYISSVDDCYDQEMCNMFRSLRWEIEHEMFNGASYQEAINEWFK